MRAQSLDRRNGEFAGEFVASNDWAGVNESLVAVNNSAEVDASFWVGKHRRQAALLNNHRKSRRGY
jgi:hypothetical protein